MNIPCVKCGTYLPFKKANLYAYATTCFPCDVIFRINDDYIKIRTIEIVWWYYHVSNETIVNIDPYGCDETIKLNGFISFDRFAKLSIFS